MKLVTFENAAGTQGIGILDGDRIAVLDGDANPAFASMLALIEAGEAGLDAARKARAGAGMIDLATVSLRAPVPVPVQMRDCLTFEKHIRQCRSTMSKLDPNVPDLEPDEVPVAQVWYDQPVYYKGNRFSVSGMDDEIVWPRGETRLDYELELGMITSRGGVDIAQADALDHVFGFTIFNDFSARDHQMREMAGGLGPAKGKDWKTANAMGPCLVTRDEIGDGSGLQMVARVNGEEWSRGNSSTMHHSFARILEHVSRDEEIRAGEFFGSGTVGGGCGLELNRFLSPGDVVELAIEGIGILRNRIGARQR
ncbi:fumarylacetoacetate hydrolase family protein [Pukyongiella litopenaei]|uniref:Fumarylacetoacetate hydrolase family protein n=1 Tax=Pukyongiella litopenaei TaxID=2605946 RepID=A0A2S0MS44_9RHOB|nr:fumarylacetoacetate hydrolase family protein [Pukyongiella litopenaei]AVO38700.1 fumarylacetoacetate hydrolase family protein [Pukyongiella litopenaei]